MTLPTVINTYAISPCNRVVYASLVQVQRDMMFGIITHMLANGYTCKGSCDGVTANLTGTAWANAAAAGTRAANVTTAVSWIIMRSANNVDYLFSYVGASDDIYRISVSHLGTYVLAGTTTHTPTSADEQVMVNTTTIATTTSGDRLWSCWARTDGKGFRVAVARAGSFVGSVFGGEMYTKATYAGGVTTSLEWAFSWTVSNLAVNSWASSTAQSCGGYVRTSLGANLGLVSLGCESFGGASALPTSDFGQAFAPELQGSTEFYFKRVSMYCVSASMRGKLGNVIDLWVGRSTGSAHGDHYGNRQFIVIGSTLVFPWDGTVSVAGTAIVMT